MEINLNHDSFFHMHSLHILETALAFAAIAAWWIFRKKRH